MKYTVIFLSALDIWSLGEGKGAPSFHKTIDLYIKKGHDVYLIKPTGKRHHECIINGLSQIKYRNGFLEWLASIRKISFFARILSSLHMKERFYQIASDVIEKCTQPCLIYAYEIHAVKAAKVLNEKYKVPYITRFQGTVLFEQQNTWINRLKFYPHFQALQQKSNLVIMTNDGTFGLKTLKELGNMSQQMMFWRNGVSVNRFSFHESELLTMRVNTRKKLGIADDSFVLLTLSRLANWKRIDRAIDAMPYVIQHYPNSILVIVGEGSMREELELHAKNIGVCNHVIFAGGIQQKETSNYYAMADIFLSLYDLGNVGNPLYEALYIGKPIITLDNGDTASIITDKYNGILLPANLPKQIPEAIVKLLDDEAMRKTLSENAREFARENFWSWDERMEAEYDVVCQMVESYYRVLEMKTYSPLRGC